MAKADTGVAGPVVSELAYRNEYISARGQARFAEEAWQRNKCQDTPPPRDTASAAPPADTKQRHAAITHPAARLY